jgi:hypothetical protein
LQAWRDSKTKWSATRFGRIMLMVNRRYGASVAKEARKTQSRFGRGCRVTIGKADGQDM